MRACPREEPPESARAARISARLGRRRAPALAPGPGRRVRAQGAAARARVALRPRPLARRTARSLRPGRRGPVPLDLADRRRQGHARPVRGVGRRAARAQRGRRGPRRRDAAAWTLPEGGVINNAAASVPTAGMQLAALREVPGGRDLGPGPPARACWRSPTRSRATGACSTSRRPTRACCRSSPTRRPRRSRRRGSTRTRSRRSASSASSSSPPPSSARSCRATCPSSPGSRSPRGTCRPARSAATTSTSSRCRAGASPSSWRTSRARASRPRCSCRRCTRRCTSRSTRRKTVADLIGRIDRHLQKYAATRKFLTCFFGLLEPRLGHAALRLGGPQSGAAAPRLRDAIEQVKATGVPIGMFPNATWREETVVDGAGRPALRLQRRHHRGARRGRRGVRHRPPGPADVARTRRARSARGCSTRWRRSPATCRSTTTRRCCFSGGADPRRLRFERAPAPDRPARGPARGVRDSGAPARGRRRLRRRPTRSRERRRSSSQAARSLFVGDPARARELAGSRADPGPRRTLRLPGLGRRAPAPLRPRQVAGDRRLRERRSAEDAAQRMAKAAQTRSRRSVGRGPRLGPEPLARPGSFPMPERSIASCRTARPSRAAWTATRSGSTRRR